MRRCAVVLVLLGAMSLCGTAVAAGPQAGAAQVGSAPRGQQLELVFPLRVDGGGLQRWANAVNTPGSPYFGQYESIAQLASRFGASAAAKNRVVGYLRAAGARNVRVDPTGLFVAAQMSAARAERLFATPLAQFASVQEGRYVAPTESVRLPLALKASVTEVLGLDTKPVFKAPALARLPRGARRVAHAAAQPTSAYPHATGTPSGCPGAINTDGFTPNQYLTAYGFGSLYGAGLRGQGERVALIEIDGFRDSDINTFAHCFGVGVPQINTFGFGINRALPPGGEATLDVELMDAAAPGLKAIDVYESTPDVARSLEAMTAPLHNPGHKPQVISASLGQCERNVVGDIGASGIDAIQNSLAMAAASGVSFLAASGDSGSADCPGPGRLPLHQLGVNYPASSTFATSVGGTQLYLTAANTLSRQVVWNDTSVAPTSAGGGGVSAGFRRPSFQNGVVSSKWRAVPDVSMLADIAPGMAIFCTAQDCLADGSPPWQAVGGTSAATPMLGAGFALVDQDLRGHRRQDLGFADPLLYEIGRSSLRGSTFSDVLQYGNDVGPYFGNRAPLGCCSARSGFDEASGWGSINLGALAQLALRMQPSAVELALPGHQRPVKSHEILATVTCGGPCRVGVLAEVTFGRAHAFDLVSTVTMSAAGRRTVGLHLSSGQLGRVRGALHAHKNVVANVMASGLDPTGRIPLGVNPSKRLKISG